MMRRARKVSLILVLIVAIYLLLPFSFGIIAQSYATRFLKNENQVLGNVLGIHLDFAQYNRGWFSSTAVIQVEKKAANGDTEILKKIPVHIEHGPSFFSKKHFKTGLGMVSGDDISLGDHSPYEISFRENIGFGGEHAAIILFNTKQNAASNNLTLNSVVLNVNSDLSAKKYLFQVVGKGLQYKEPSQSLSIMIQTLRSTLVANYLGKQDWKLTFGLGLDNNQLSAQLPDHANTAVTVHLDQLNLSQLHFNTKRMAKLVSEFIELKQADDSQQPAKPSAWMALFQQLLTSVIAQDTQASVDGLKVTTPMGELHADYSASFPTLPKAHDYFDIATRDVGGLTLNIPNWTYTNATTNEQFSLSNLKYRDRNNTVFLSNSKLTLGALDVVNLNLQPKTSSLHIANLQYQGGLHGDTNNLSQMMEWQASQICVAADCAHAIQGQLQLSNMDFNAFRGIAKATQALVQPSNADQDSIGARWMDVGNAYAKLISAKSHVEFSHDMNTAQGAVKIKGQLTWPNFSASATGVSPFDEALNQSSYHLNVFFPAYYVNSFIKQQQTAAIPMMPRTGISSMPITAPKEPPFELQAAQFLQYAIDQGYLKKIGATYSIDLVGKGHVLMINGVAWKTP